MVTWQEVKILQSDIVSMPTDASSEAVLEMKGQLSKRVEELVLRIRKEGLFDQNYRALINPARNTKRADYNILFKKMFKVTRAINTRVIINDKEWIIRRYIKNRNTKAHVCFKGLNHFHLFNNGIQFQSNRGVNPMMRWKAMKGMKPMSKFEAMSYIRAILMKLV